MHHNYLAIIAFTLYASLSSSNPFSALQSTVVPESKEFSGMEDSLKIDKVNQLISKYVNEDGPGIALAVVSEGELVCALGQGQANLEYGIPITTQTPFHLASVSKQFTAMAVQLLVDEGKLSWDDPLGKFFRSDGFEPSDRSTFGSPDAKPSDRSAFPAWGDSITLKHLVHHTSGLREQFALLMLAGWQWEDVIKTEQIISIIQRQQSLNFSPGDQFDYSNTGYTLLAEVVKKISGESFESFTRKKIFEPLKMYNTFFFSDPGQIVKNRAYSYDQSENPVKNKLLNYETVGPTSLFSTAEDLAKWAMAWDNSQLYRSDGLEPSDRDDGLEPSDRDDTFPSEAFQKMTATHQLNSGEEIPYRLGLESGELDGFATLEHSGRDAGFRTHFLRLPEKKLSVILLANEANITATSIAHHIAQIYLETENQKDGSITKKVNLTTETLEELTGLYELNDLNMVIKIEKIEHGLSLWIHENLQYMLFPISDTSFIAEEESLILTFDQDAKNIAISFPNEEKIKGKKLPESTDSVSDSDYIGMYFSDELLSFYKISNENGRLYIHHLRHGKKALIPMGEGKFIWQIGGLLVPITFLREEEAGVNRFEISMFGIQKMAFIRKP
ncbi:serine hydrolase domain-containing protein [Pleomorphovibrio marinus]|uniref:serine hydrolase domain-containing protein n=1 Tax=Pleomorphovibrio marinus TaxID=2164132 RepID=UPI000E0A432C|nr:serine hydrolase domain-containing protein [Pleomorphovibrio marinus]